MELTNDQTTKLLATCSLCGLTTLHPLANERGDAFCCPSCREVAALLVEATAETPRDASEAAAPITVKGEAKNVTLALGGMYCSSCAWLVEEQLKRTKGVASAEVNYIQQQASLTFDSAVTNPQLLKKRVKTLGYRATLPDEKPHDEEESFFMRLAICSVLVLHDVIVGGTIYARELLGIASAETEWLVDFFRLMMLVTAVPVLLLLGLPILRAGLASLLRGQPNIHTLITIGTFSAFGISVWNYARGHTSQIYFDTASMLIYLISIGHWLEMQAHKASSESVERLLKQIPETAALVTAEGEKEITVAELKPGMRVRVRPGGRFPVDGLIASGEGDVDASLLTGEPRPVTKREGDAVQAGTISLDGSFEVIASAVGSATAAGQIGRLLHEALWNRSPLERMADKMSAWLTYGAVALAAITFLFWNYQSDAEHALLVALTVLLIACPCALGLATPLTLWLALGRAADSGAILRSTGAIERLARVKKIFFDKTGTLTMLPMRVKHIVSEEMAVKDFVLRVASVENQSEHPLAKAIVTYARKKRIKLSKPKEFTALPGRGVEATLNIPSLRGADGRVGGVLPPYRDQGDEAIPTTTRRLLRSARNDGMKVWVGSEQLMNDQNLRLPASLSQKADDFRGAGMSVVFAGWDGQARGLIALGETARAEAAEAVDQARARGLSLEVLTGDEAQAGRRWQEALGIPVHAALSPDEKMSRLQAESDVAMVGDGINDGPALAAASVGLAMNHGTDVASAAADVVLMREDLRLVPWLVDLSRHAMLRVKQNLGWAVIYNLIGVALAVAGLLTPLLAALAMVLSSVIVTANAMRLRKFPLLDDARS